MRGGRGEGGGRDRGLEWRRDKERGGVLSVNFEKTFKLREKFIRYPRLITIYKITIKITKIGVHETENIYKTNSFRHLRFARVNSNHKDNNDNTK